ncbi:MAG: acyl-[acyl-carrier-protein] thioesterase, partial [Eubacterium sp.]|nr:acyl-[acyl-carrier-protein] thioesterase [Eubacterium sp.]
MYTRTDRVSYSRIDKDGLLGVSNVIDCLQDCALFHSEDVGHGALALREKNRAWLVSSWHVVFQRRPAMGEDFSTHTWAYKMKGIFGSRNFVMETPDKEVLAYADSRWFYFDQSTGQPAMIEPEEAAAYPLESA